MSTIKRLIQDVGENPSKQDVYNYIAKMYETDMSATYIINTSVAIERWMNFIGKPIDLGRPRKSESLIPETLNEGEVARIIAAAKNIREKAIITTLAYSGIRNKELTALKVKNIDFTASSIRIKRGKGKRDRIAYLSNQALMIIRKYLDDYPRNDQEYLFTTLSGKKYTDCALRKLCKVLSKRARIEKRVFPHLFRHSLATNLLNRGCSLMTIKEVLGHKKIETTLIYAHSNPRRIKQEYDFYCPMYV